MKRHIFISFLIFLAQSPAMVIAIPCLAVMLKTKWDGRTYFFGNSKWGRATDHYLVPTNGVYWKEFTWMAFRNPVYNLGKHTLSIKMQPSYHVEGNENIGDKIKAGYYRITMGRWWEYYWVHKYYFFGKWRCVRARIGWKISGNTTDECEFVFSINPWKSFTGI